MASPLPPRAMATALIVATASFMQMLDASIIGTALPSMAMTFGVTPVAVGLGIVVYVLAAAIVIPASSWIGDRFGARRVFIAAIGVFVVASVLCGLSTNLPAFVAARVLQGVAGAIMMPVGQLLVVHSADRSQLLRVMTISGAPMMVAPVLGPALGGLMVETIGWQWIFFINVPIGLLGMAIAANVLERGIRNRRPFDVLGFALNAATLALLIGGVEMLNGQAGVSFAALAIIAAGLIVGYFAIRHLQAAPHPIVSLEPFRILTFRIAVAQALPFVRIPIGALLFALPILLQVGFGWSAFHSGLALLAHASGDLMMKVFMTLTFRRFGYRRILLLSAPLMSLGVMSCALLPSNAGLAIGCVLFASGCFRSFLMTGLSTLALADVPHTHIPSAITINHVAFQLASALSVTLATMCFDASVFLRGGAEIMEIDCRVALATLGMIGLFAMPSLLRLPHSAGQELSGHSRLVAAAAE